jgi:hypothetical protein
MAEAESSERGRERPVYRGGGNRFEKEGGKRPYKGSPRFADETQRFEGYANKEAPPGERPSFGDPPTGFKKSFKKDGFKPGFKKEGFKKEGFKPGGGFKKDGFKSGGFKKKFTGKAAGAKGSYKGGKAFRDKNR